MMQQARANRVFQFAIALLCVSGVATYLSFFYSRIGERWVTHTQEVRATVGDLEATVNEAGRARMGYLMSGVDSELGDYRSAVSRIPAVLLHLRELTQDNPAQVDNCARLDSLTTGRINTWQEEIRQRQAGAAIDYSAILAQNVPLASQYAAATGAVRAEESRLLQIRTRTAQRRFIMAVATVGLSFAIGLLLLYLYFRMLTEELRARTEAQEALRTANQELGAEVAERRAAEQRLEKSEKSLRELSLHVLRSQEEERKRIGRELHDSLGQYLAMLKLNLDLLDSAEDQHSNSNREQIQQCVRLAEESMREVRTISYLLYPPMLEEVGLKSAIPWYLEGFSTRSNVQTSFEIDPEFGRLDRDVELALFRILQESLTNVHRHSGSAVANVRLSMTNGCAVLQIADRGKGIPDKLLRTADGHASLGVGVRGMNERVRQLGGKLEITSSPTGTAVTASVPANGQSAA